MSLGGGSVHWLLSVAPILTDLGQRFLPCPCFGSSVLAALFYHFGANNSPKRTYLKNPDTRSSVPIFAIGLSLYESVPGLTSEQIGSQVVRTQWLYVVLSATHNAPEP